MTNNSILKKVVSADGTGIAVEQAGSGSPLLLVHGTGADRSYWGAVLPKLAEFFTVYAIDRRGRGDSGDAAEYAIQKEYEDVVAVAAASGEPVFILGHSFGAGCVLGAAPQIPNLRALVLYEPPMLVDDPYLPRAEAIRRMEAALNTGNREMVVDHLLADMLHVTPAGIEKAHTSAAWSGQVASAHTIPRELRSTHDYAADREALQTIQAPTLFLLGSETRESFKSTTEMLHGLLRNSRIATLLGQQHNAILTAPDLFSAEVIRFLREQEVCSSPFGKVGEPPLWFFPERTALISDHGLN